MQTHKKGDEEEDEDDEDEEDEDEEEDEGAAPAAAAAFSFESSLLQSTVLRSCLTTSGPMISAKRSTKRIWRTRIVWWRGDGQCEHDVDNVRITSIVRVRTCISSGNALMTLGSSPWLMCANDGLLAWKSRSAARASVEDDVPDTRSLTSRMAVLSQANATRIACDSTPPHDGPWPASPAPRCWNNEERVLVVRECRGVATTVAKGHTPERCARTPRPRPWPRPPRWARLPWSPSPA